MLEVSSTQPKIKSLTVFSDSYGRLKSWEDHYHENVKIHILSKKTKIEKIRKFQKFDQ
jgi:hypothetical protein